MADLISNLNQLGPFFLELSLTITLLVLIIALNAWAGKLRAETVWLKQQTITRHRGPMRAPNRLAQPDPTATLVFQDGSARVRVRPPEQQLSPNGR